MIPDNRLVTRSECNDDNAVLYLEGELISQTRFEVERILREWQESGVRWIVVHMPALRYIDSAGLSTLLGALHRYRREGGDLILAELNPSLCAIFEVTSMEKYFKIFPTVGEARAHYKHTKTASETARDK
ncbi:STAS domain-containing protein [bacterium]|nr:STAS domain-containing protein [bacterium]